MLVNNALDTLVKLIRVKTKQSVQPFVLPPVDYQGYVVVPSEIEILGNYANRFHIVGYVFKAIPLTADANYSLFEFLGKVIEDDELGSISFEKKGEFLVKDIQSTGLGYGLKVDFKAEIIVGEEPVPSLIKEVHGSFNDDDFVIKEEDYWEDEVKAKS